MIASENLPATKRHKGRHKREGLRESQKCKGRCAKNLWHIGLQASGEGGIRTRGVVTPTQHFQCCTFGRSVTSPNYRNSLQFHFLRRRLSCRVLSKGHLSKTVSNSGPLNVRHTVKAGAFRVAEAPCFGKK